MHAGQHVGYMWICPVFLVLGLLGSLLNLVVIKHTNIISLVVLEKVYIL